MTDLYLIFHQTSSAPHKEDVHVRDSVNRIGYIEYQLSRASHKPFLLMMAGVQERFNTLKQARDFALKHVKRIYTKVECEN